MKLHEDLLFLSVSSVSLPELFCFFLSSPGSCWSPFIWGPDPRTALCSWLGCHGATCPCRVGSGWITLDRVMCSGLWTSLDAGTHSELKRGPNGQMCKMRMTTKQCNLWTKAHIIICNKYFRINIKTWLNIGDTLVGFWSRMHFKMSSPGQCPAFMIPLFAFIRALPGAVRCPTMPNHAFPNGNCVDSLLCTRAASRRGSPSFLSACVPKATANLANSWAIQEAIQPNQTNQTIWKWTASHDPGGISFFGTWSRNCLLRVVLWHLQICPALTWNKMCQSWKHQLSKPP